MDLKSLVPKLNKLVSLLEQYTQEKSTGDYETLSGLLNNTSNIVFIPAGRYVVHEPLVLDRFNTSKIVQFHEDAVVFFDFKATKSHPAFIVNANKCTIHGGTFVANTFLLEVNGDGNVFEHMRGLGNISFNGIGNAMEFCYVLSSVNIPLSCGKDNDSSSPQAAVKASGDNTIIKHCLLNVTTSVNLNDGIDYACWKFIHAWLLMEIMELLGDEDKSWINYECLYSVPHDRLSYLRQFLATEVWATRKHAKRVTQMIKTAIVDDQSSGFSDKFFTMLKRPWHPDMEVLVLELFVLWKTRAEKCVGAEFDNVAKMYAIDKTLSGDVTKHLDSKRLLKSYLQDRMGLPPLDLALIQIERDADDLRRKVRQQMIEDTMGLNGLQKF